MSKVKVRIAPSPTGSFHIGNAQSAIYNWLFARKNKGSFYVRIEDTDKARSTKESEKNIMEALIWLGLKWDPPSRSVAEGFGGVRLGFGRASGDVVRQSDNLNKHRELLEKLLSEGKAFYCYHNQKELDSERKNQKLNKEAPRHICEHKHKRQETRDKEQGIIRLAVDAGSDRIISFDDQIRGKVEFKQSLLGDFSIARAIDDPLYNFAVVADDNAMEISHVIRGEDHISNTPKQILIYEALGFAVPVFAHLPLILGSDRSKLSKRHGGTATLDYKIDYLPEALVNFLGSLSFTFSKEIITKEEMAGEFELSKIHKSGAVFNIEKLNWINSQYIKTTEPQKLKELTGINEMPDKAVPLITERLEKLSDVNNFDYFWKEPNYDSNLLNWPPKARFAKASARRASLAKDGKDFSKDEVIKSLEEVTTLLQKAPFSEEGCLLDKNALRLELDELGKKLGDRGLVYWPFRVALTGREKSPDPVEVAGALSKKEILKRIDIAVKKLD